MGFDPTSPGSRPSEDATSSSTDRQPWQATAMEVERIERPTSQCKCDVLPLTPHPQSPSESKPSVELLLDDLDVLCYLNLEARLPTGGMDRDGQCTSSLCTTSNSKDVLVAPVGARQGLH